MESSVQTESIYRQAYDCLVRRNLAEAERLCHSLLKVEPRHAGAHYLLGLAKLAGRDYPGAVQLLQRAIQLGEVSGAAYSNLAMAQKALGQLQEALGNFGKAISLAPDFAGAVIERGHLLLDAGRTQAAAADYQRALLLDPANPHALNGLGNIQLQSGAAAGALECFERAAALLPRAAWLQMNRATALLDLGRPEQALMVCEAVLAWAPQEAAVHHTRGDALQDLRRFEDASAAYGRALALDAQRAKTWANLGRSLLQVNRCREAIESYDRALQLSRAADQAGARADLFSTLTNRGAALHQAGLFEQAEASCRQACLLEPERAEAHANLAQTLLLQGDFAQGWREFEWRWKVPGVAASRHGSRALWSGTPSLAGKRILLHSEQGLGDTLQFCRYATMLAERFAARVILEVQAPLVGLLHSLRGVEQVIAIGQPLPETDYQCPLMSVPLAVGTDLHSIPADTPYLQADAHKVRYWQSRLGEPEALRVGLVWSGGFRPEQPELWAVNARRNLSLRLLRPLKVAGVEFYSLQKGQPAESELAALKSETWDGPDLIDWTSELYDFSDTAALIENLDLVISVDTSTAHLAGALNKPVWVLNRFDSCWRWLRDRNDSPWYPAARLYRQEHPGDWSGVVARVARDLERQTSAV